MKQQLERIQLGISKLKELHQNALIENDILRAENKTLQEKLLECENSSALASKKQLIDGITDSSTSSDSEKKQMKLKINELVREVDKCIALLNQ